MEVKRLLAHLIFTFSPLLACVWRTVHANTTFRSSWRSRHELSSSVDGRRTLIFLAQGSPYPLLFPTQK